MKETIFRRRGAVLLALSFFTGLGLPLGYAADVNDWAATAERSDRRLLTKPKDNAAWADLIEARICLKDFTRAAEALQIWRRNVPKVSRSYPLVERLQGDLACSQGKWDEAIEAWQRYVQESRKDLAGWDRLAWALERQQRIPEAIEAVSSALKVKADAGHYAWRAGLKILQRDWDGADADIRAGNKLDASDSDVQALFPKFEREGEWRGRMKLLDDAVQANATDAAPLLERMELMAHEGFLAGAFEDAAEAARRNPQSLRAQVWRGALAWETGRWKTGAGDVSQTSRAQLKEYDPHWIVTLRQLDRDTDPDIRARTLLFLHQPLLAYKQVEAVDGSPIKPLVLLELQDIPKAGAAARRAVESHPESAAAWEAMARLNLVNGNPREALQNLDRCEQLNPAGKYGTLRKEAEAVLGNK